MKSDYERRAAEEAVDAVERRWQRADDMRRKMEKRQSALKLLKVLVTMVVVGIAGLISWRYFGEECFDDPSACGGMFRFLRELVEERAPGGVQDEFGACIERLLTKPLKLASELPAEAVPTKAPVGTSYAALGLSAHGGFDLYELKSDGKGHLSVGLRSPFTSASQALTWAAFKEACGKVYLVECGDSVYVCGSQDLADGEKIKDAVRSILMGR